MSASKNSKAMSGDGSGSEALAFAAEKGFGRSPSTSTGPVSRLDWQAKEDLFFRSRVEIAGFFRKHRLSANVTLEQVRDSLSLESTDIAIAYESGDRPIPLEDVFALTNLLNIPPEEVLALIFDTTSQQGLR